MSAKTAIQETVREEILDKRTVDMISSKLLFVRVRQYIAESGCQAYRQKDYELAKYYSDAEHNLRKIATISKWVQLSEQFCQEKTLLELLVENEKI